MGTSSIFHDGDGTQKSATSTCPICLGDSASPAYKFPRFDLLICPQCSHLFSILKVAPEAYEAEYFLEANKEHWENPEEQLFDELDALIQKHKPIPREELRTLDVGTATGYLPRHFGALGYESWGVDISEEAIQHGTQQLNIPRLQAANIEIYVPEQPFPVVTNNYVLEHVTDPVPFLKGIRRSLSDDGIFICTTVDSNSLIFKVSKFLYRITGGRAYAPLERICEVHHLNHFTRESLELALNTAGFEIVERFNHNLPLRTLTLRPLQRVAVAVLYGLSPILDSWFAQGVVCRPKESGS